ncbi:MAG: leucyl aminopeptidase, partial [Gammaproteobacteria bacterium]|nr:leucyl aminopeptidase [Gammaproteobacteria bacterium]
LVKVPGLGTSRVMLLGLGKEADLDSLTLQKAVKSAASQLVGTDIKHATFALEDAAKKLDPLAALRDTVLAVSYGSYRFEHCKTVAKAKKKIALNKVSFVAEGKSAAKRKTAVKNAAAVASGVEFTRDLGNLPGNICTPTYLANEAKKLAKEHAKLKVTVLDEKKMKELKMGSLLSVSRGSRQPAKLIIFEWKGGKAGDKPNAIVGKGLTFDAGGISLKPAPAMDEMKYDMCGGASVFGAMKAVCEMGLNKNVVGVVPASENLPDGDANKPGDIVTSMSGQTIEILNTDAEGRLILCDALTYTERFKPKTVIDIATLTGACVVALGSHASGLMGNDDKLIEKIKKAADDSSDRVWQLPLWSDYDRQLDSPFADMQNIGGKEAGSITAGCFLARFTRKFKWAHLDVAGTAWGSGAEKSASGRPVPLLVQYLMDN